MSKQAVDLEEPCITVETQNDGIVVKKSAKLLYTSFVLFVYFVGGALKGQEGVSFLDLLIITRSDMETGSLLLTCSALGFMVGPLILGFLFDRYNNTALFCLFIICSGSMTFVIPWCSHLAVMCAAFAFRNLLTSGVDIGALVITVKLWKEEVNPYMQAIQAMFALGGIAAPLVTGPFLTQAPKAIYESEDYFNDVMTLNGSTLSDDVKPNSTSVISIHKDFSYPSYTSGSFNNSQEATFLNTSDPNVKTDVYIAYSIVGGCMCLSALPILILWISQTGDRLIRQQTVVTAQKEMMDPEKQRKPSKFLPLAVVLVGLFFFVYGPVEKTSANFLVPFLVKHLNWSKMHASQGSSTFYAGFAGGRFVGIALALVLPTTAMLFIFMIALVIAFGLFILAVNQTAVFIWVCVVLTGVTMSTIYASMYAWVDVNITPITGKMASAMQVTLALGAISSTPLIGYLFKNHTPLWFLYLSITNASVCLISYSALYRLSSTFLRARQPLTPEETQFLEQKNEGEGKNSERH